MVLLLSIPIHAHWPQLMLISICLLPHLSLLFYPCLVVLVDLHRPRSCSPPFVLIFVHALLCLFADPHLSLLVYPCLVMLIDPRWSLFMLICRSPFIPCSFSFMHWAPQPLICVCIKYMGSTYIMKMLTFIS